MYNEVNYWNKRQNPNSADIDSITPQHLEFVKSQLEGKKILEFGPGIGRILPAYTGYDVSVFDVSTNYLDRLKNKAKSLNIELDITIDNNPSVQNHIIPYDDNQFDVVVCVSVLLHQRPQNIVQIMKELARVGKKVIVISWSEEGIEYEDHKSKYEGDKYCFHYDFNKICRYNKMKVIKWEAKPELRQIFFTYE